MESFNNSNNKRSIALGMPPLPPTSQRMEGQSSQNPNIHPQKKIKRTLARKQQAVVFDPEEILQMKQLEWTVKSLEADLTRDFYDMHFWKRQQYLFRGQNDELKRQLEFFSQKVESKEAEYVELKKEKDKLNEMYVEQQQKYLEITKGSMAYAQFMGMDQPGLPTYYNFM
ncbi:BAG domain-containing protein [Psidium guajava]|nr:BAG domain-containing protein [Psidium guajava]